MHSPDGTHGTKLPAASNGVAEAIRTELISTLQKGPLTASLCARLGRMLDAARNLLQAQDDGVESLLGARSSPYATVMAPSSSQENFGSSIARELLSGLRSMSPGRDPAKLTEALVTARKNNLPEVAKSIESALKGCLADTAASEPEAEAPQPVNGGGGPVGVLPLPEAS